MFNADSLQQFHFLRPVWLLLLPVLGYVFYYLKNELSQHANWHSLLAPHLRRHLSLPAQDKKRANPLNFSVLLLILGSIALAGPTWQRQSSPLVEDEALLVIAIDMSHSMNQQDVQPSRLERAKQKIVDLVEARGGARTGLIVFSGSAHMLVPITNDIDVQKHFLAAAKPEMMPIEGKNTEKVLPLLAGMFDQSSYGAPPIPGTLLLITDGINESASDQLVEYFSGSEHQLLILGVGKELADSSTSSMSDESESQRPAAISGLDKATLVDLADDSGGSYQTSTLDQSDIIALNWRITNHLLDVDDESRPWVDKGYFLLYPIALLLMFWFRKGWTIVPLLVCTIFLSASGSIHVYATDQDDLSESQRPSSGLDISAAAQSAKNRWLGVWLSGNQMGRRCFNRGEFLLAAHYFDSLHWRATAYYHAEEFELAAETFATLSTPVALFNQANAWAHGQHYIKALDTYDTLLQQEPDNSDAANNRKVVQELVDEINAMSESQQDEAGVSSRELGDEPQRAEGAERQEWAKKELEQYSAERILTEEKIQELWMKQVQQDPSRFLSVKFQMQVNEQTEVK